MKETQVGWDQCASQQLHGGLLRPVSTNEAEKCFGLPPRSLIEPSTCARDPQGRIKVKGRDGKKVKLVATWETRRFTSLSTWFLL
jgi:hypothetical protein